LNRAENQAFKVASGGSALARDRNGRPFYISDGTKSSGHHAWVQKIVCIYFTAFLLCDRFGRDRTTNWRRSRAANSRWKPDATCVTVAATAPGLPCGRHTSWEH
jgi:hypothetical protein